MAAVDRALRYDDGLPRAWELRGLALHKLERDRDALKGISIHALITDGGNLHGSGTSGALSRKNSMTCPGHSLHIDRAVWVNPLFFVGWHNRGLVLLPDEPFR